MTILITLIMTALAVYMGKELLSAKHKEEMQPIRIKAETQRPKKRR